MKCLFISDAHYPKNDAVIDFLLESYYKFDIIFILGDLFEFYYGYKGYFYSHHLKLINLLNLISKKKKVVIFEGNHEYKLEAIKEFINADVVKKDMKIRLDTLDVHIEHGDVIDKKDIAYRLFRGALKNRLTLAFIDKISPPLLYMMSKRASDFSKKRLSSKKKCRGTDEALELFAAKKIKEGFDVVILAHTHKPTIKKIGNGLYINSGDFFDKFSYIVYDTKTGFSLKFLKRGENNE